MIVDANLECTDTIIHEVETREHFFELLLAVVTMRIIQSVGSHDFNSFGRRSLAAILLDDYVVVAAHSLAREARAFACLLFLRFVVGESVLDELVGVGVVLSLTSLPHSSTNQLHYLSVFATKCAVRDLGWHVVGRAPAAALLRAGKLGRRGPFTESLLLALLLLFLLGVTSRVSAPTSDDKRLALLDLAFRSLFDFFFHLGVETGFLLVTNRDGLIYQALVLIRVDGLLNPLNARYSANGIARARMLALLLEEVARLTRNPSDILFPFNSLIG